MLFETIDTPRELFTYKLGSALEMEQDVLKMLDDLEDKARSPELKQMLSQHADQTRGHVRNIELAFDTIGEKADDKPCPAMEGIDKEAKANVRKAEEPLVDTVILSGAIETEHHEIAVYENLVMQAEAMGQPAVATLLRQNLEQEEQTLLEARRAAQDLTRRTMATAP
jgi:ferritin-like metal-binding protein YciE